VVYIPDAAMMAGLLTGNRQLLSPKILEAARDRVGWQFLKSQNTSFSDCGNISRHSFAIMALLETIEIPHLPSSLPVHVVLYRNVENADYLKQQLLAGNSEFEYALIDASMV
jgi:hypothetical protein